jgi:hypothetical protein
MAMVVRGKRRRCRFCNQLFVPDPRLKGRQLACSAPDCQRQRKEAGQEQWLSRNPGYFEGRYPKVKAWLSSHPGYLARYRREHPDKVECDKRARKRRHLKAREAHADIQVAISLQAPVQKALKPFLARPPIAAIQDPLLSEVIVLSLFSTAYLSRGRADMQDPIADGAAHGYPPHHESAGQTAAPAGAYAEGPEVLQLG